MSATYATNMAATTVTARLNLIVSDNENDVELACSMIRFESLTGVFPMDESAAKRRES